MHVNVLNIQDLTCIGCRDVTRGDKGGTIP